MQLSRRGFLSGISSAALAVAVSRTAAPSLSFRAVPIEFDSPGAERSAVWIIESTARGYGYFWELYRAGHAVSRDLGTASEWIPVADFFRDTNDTI